MLIALYGEHIKTSFRKAQVLHVCNLQCNWIYFESNRIGFNQVKIFHDIELKHLWGTEDWK